MWTRNVLQTMCWDTCGSKWWPLSYLQRSYRHNCPSVPFVLGFSILDFSTPGTWFFQYLHFHTPLSFRSPIWTYNYPSQIRWVIGWKLRIFPIPCHSAPSLSVIPWNFTVKLTTRNIQCNTGPWMTLTDKSLQKSTSCRKRISSSVFPKTLIIWWVA